MDSSQSQHDHQSLTRDNERLQSQYAEIATLAGGLAHEIRNPLSTIALNLDLLLEDLSAGDSPRERRMLQKVTGIRKQCLNLERLLNDFLQFARMGSLEQQPVDLNGLVQEFIDFYQPQAKELGVEISPHLMANLPHVNIDSRLFLQVLTNLSRNAQQAMPRGGVLELQTYTRDGRVMLDIIDNGEGMTAETQSKMFDTFYSTKSDGSGLGLPTVRKIVEAHGGTILCDSEPGRGTRFSISLPAVTTSKRTTSAGRGEASASARSD
jgi:two-component system sensor histidine kinase HydH